VLLLKRKFNSLLWRLTRALSSIYLHIIRYFVELITEKYWLLDHLPTLEKKQEEVLLVRLDLIGDFILWLDAARAYRLLYPNAKISLAVNDTCAELAQTLPYWDEVIGINVGKLRSDFFYRLCTLVRLRLRNFSISIQPTFSRELVGDLVVRSSSAAARIGYAGDCNNISPTQKTITDLWYSRLISNHMDCKMELNINAHFVRELGYSEFLSSIPIIAKTVDPPKNLCFTSPYVVICPGASWQPRMWPVAYFAELILELNRQFDLHFLLCGGESEREICVQLMHEVNLQNLTNLAGASSLLDLLEIIRAATLVVSNESSPVHMASATGVPSVCILGGGFFGRFLPYQIEQKVPTMPPSAAVWQKMDCFGCSWKCILNPAPNQPVPCISIISVETVLNACKRALLPGNVGLAKLSQLPY
jgi:ADP-heptose:LPS heptosyltransferase